MNYPSPKRNQKGEIVKQSPMAYNPSQEAKDITARVRDDFDIGYTNWNKPLNEYNGRSVIEEINANQKAFNSYIPPRSEDPEESWRAQTVRPIVRNKLISIAAHVTAAIIYPNIFAQTQDDDEDKMAAEIMKDIVDWIIDNSNYSKSFINAVISALVDPAVVVEQEFREVIREVRRMQADGSYTKEEIVDEVLSGFQTHVVPLSEILLANLYEPNIQRQRFIIRQRYIDYGEAKLEYGDHENFKFVTPGSYAYFDIQTQTFYETKQLETKNLVHEVKYYSRLDDLELTFVNGVLVSDPDCPIKRYDKLYGFAMSGFEPINNGVFALYKSAANKLGPDEDLVNTLYNMVMDGTFMALMPPLAIYGKDQINSSVMIPGSMTNFSAESKVDSIGPRSDLRAGLMAIEEVEKSISESSQDNMRSGQAIGGERTAYEVQALQENAQKMLGLFGKFIMFLVHDIGQLMVGDILQYMTVPDIKKITNVTDPVAYKTLLIPEKIQNGKKITKKIKFTGEYLDKDDVNPAVESMKIYKEEKKAGENVRIYKINPEIFRNIKYKIVITPDKFENRSKTLEKALNLELYDRAIANPLVDQNAVTRDFLFETYKPGQSEKYMKKEEPVAPAPGSPAGVPPAFESPTGTNLNMVSQITGNNSLKNALSKG
jgi:hypothetical protein